MEAERIEKRGALEPTQPQTASRSHIHPVQWRPKRPTRIGCRGVRRRDPRTFWLARSGAILAAVSISIPILATAGHTSAASTLFAPHQSLTLGTDTKAVAVGDVTGDGRADVVATSAQGFYDDYRVYVLAG